MPKVQQDLLVKLLLEFKRYKADESTLGDLLDAHEEALKEFNNYMKSHEMQEHAMQSILSLHALPIDVGGMTSGYCNECGKKWPCDTYHRAKSYGEIYQCEESKWCEHLGVPL